ncbi:hypothetical protein ACFUVV_35670 [Streptomyces sp. NPDC057376]|uniref:hypothetical protein n=1 Tax=unclassified Streptomyces TaxID=2593676 RepID=UPI00093EF32B|nr:hypothetical protein [Streptomyces sp. CB02414]OKI86125.1 hypothetical protein AMK11_14945 [Streptomyces sp. CB02414]
MPVIAAAKAALTDQRIETPSWGCGNCGTCFKVFVQPGVPRTPWEKPDGAADGVRGHRDRTEGVPAHPARRDRLTEALATVYERLGDDQRLLLEYQFFAPAFCATDVPDWGTSHLQRVQLGENVHVMIDTGRHAPGTNIQFIVALLLRGAKHGGFDFSSRFHADDDLMAGSADPFQLAPARGHRKQRISAGDEVAFMLDQCRTIEAKIPAVIRTVINVQEATAKALLVDTEALRAAGAAGDVLAAPVVLMDAYSTDVRPPAPGPVVAYTATRPAEGLTRPTPSPDTRTPITRRNTP